MQRIIPNSMGPISRQFTTSAFIASKASKNRSHLPKVRPPGPVEAGSLGTRADRGVGATSPNKQPSSRAEDAPATKPNDIEQEMLDAQHVDSGSSTSGAPEELRGTGVGASEAAYGQEEPVVGRDGVKVPGRMNASAQEEQGPFGDDGYTPEEPIYTAPPPYNVPLVLTASFVVATLSINAADMARVGYADWDETLQEYKLAPKWKRYTFASGFGLVGLAVIWWGALAPGRIITRMTIRRPVAAAGVAFPRDALLNLYTPLQRLPGLRAPRTIALSDVNLLGPLSDRPQSYHPKIQNAPERPPRQDPLSKLFRRLSKLLIAESAPTQKKPWKRGGGSGFSHSPILINGDRATYSIAVKRGPTGKMDDPKGAWCAGWDQLEKAFLNVKN